MSALAKRLIQFHDKTVGAAHEGSVWVPEAEYEKWVEFARREVKSLPADGYCQRHGIKDCLICARSHGGGSR